MLKNRDRTYGDITQHDAVVLQEQLFIIQNEKEVERHDEGNHLRPKCNTGDDLKNKNPAAREYIYLYISVELHESGLMLTSKTTVLNNKLLALINGTKIESRTIFNQTVMNSNLYCLTV